MNSLSAQKFSNYWFETGIPTFLLDLIRTQEYDIAACLQELMKELFFSAYDVERVGVAFDQVIWHQDVRNKNFDHAW